MWIVYSLYNREANRIYVGQTNNLVRRLKEHNDKGGDHFTAKATGTWEVIYQETCASRKEALIREKQLKSYRGREFIKKLIIPL